MNKALIEGATHNPGAPKGWDRERDGECGGLPIRIVQNDGGGIGCQSAWKPTPEELAVLTDGGYVVLHIVGWRVPVALSVTDRTGAQEL